MLSTPVTSPLSWDLPARSTPPTVPLLLAGTLACVGMPVALALLVAHCRTRARRTEDPTHPAWMRGRLVAHPGDADSLAVDCVSRVCPSLTHHRGGATPEELRADTSGGTVLNAAKAGHALLKRPRVCCNHADVDALVSLYAALRPEEALQREGLLRACSHVGDFRELDLQEAHHPAALAVCVWFNACERTLFSRPFEGGKLDGEEGAALRKHAYFLPRLPAALALAEAAGVEAASVLPADCVLREAAGVQFAAEMERVLADVALLAAQGPSAVRRYDELGLVVVDCPRPLHYYALFGVTRGADAVLALYPGNCFELEQKYTGFVRLSSRDTRPRLDLRPLATALSAAEGQPELAWVADAVTDSGPLLRLERRAEKHLSKADRYKNPHEREMVASALSPAAMEAAVLSFYRHAGAAAAPRQDWSWAEIHAANEAAAWGSWHLPPL